MSEEKNLLEVSHLKQYFPVHQGFKTIPLKAVDDISFAIKPGETLGLVGVGMRQDDCRQNAASTVSADCRTHRVRW